MAGLGAVHAEAAGRRVLPYVLRCYLPLAWFMRRFRGIWRTWQAAQLLLTVRPPGTLP